MIVSMQRSEVEAYCARIGSDPLLVQGAGGNVSWKDGDVLWIKASGTWLKDALDQDVFVPVDLQALNASLKRNDFSVQAKVIGDSSLRPSIETLLHCLMPHPLVVHVHAIEVLAWMVRADPIPELKDRLSTFQYPWSLVEYKKPGSDLARVISCAINSNPSVDVVFMSNHGVVIGGNSVGDVDKKLQSLVHLLSIRPTRPVKPAIVAPFNLDEAMAGYVSIDDELISQLAFDKRIYNRISDGWAIYPDHIVFLGPKPNLVGSECRHLLKADPNEYTETILFIEDVGVFSKGELTEAQKAQLICYYDVMSRQSDDWKLATLSHQDVLDLIDWDAETYRQSISK